MSTTAGDVVFDYDGALSAARRLWSLADDLQTMMTDRERARTDASVGFTGPYATELTSRISSERTDVNSAVVELRNAATAWASAWKDAMDQQNQNLYARAYKYSEDHQGFLGLGKLNGIERPPAVEPLGTPQPPSFAATGSFQDFMSAVS